MHIVEEFNIIEVKWGYPVSGYSPGFRETIFILIFLSGCLKGAPAP